MATFKLVSRAKVINHLSQNKDYLFRLDISRQNGRMLGCYGFIKNLKNNRVVYINTDCSSIHNSINQKPSILYRFAKNIGDYQGLTNRYVNNFNDLISNVNKLLTDESVKVI